MWEVFIIGLVGSLHCAGMCGPIVMAMPAGDSAARRWLGRILYNVGRLFTYSALGAIVALAGAGAALFRAQQVFSIVLGVILLAWALQEWGLIPKKWRINPLANAGQLLRKVFSFAHQRRGVWGHLLVGMANGLLPCGLVYVGLAAAAATADVAQGALTMVLFGLGTWPMMLALMTAPQAVPLKVRQRVTKWVPGFIVCLGLLLIVRGMSLGIPYLSPAMKVDAKGKTEMSCCKVPVR
jgi:sulfite exporter TauE/SafE